MTRWTQAVGVAAGLAALGVGPGPPEPPGVTHGDHPGLVRAVSLGSESTDVVFIIDGSGSIGPGTFQFEKDALVACVQGFPTDGSVAVAVVQFASSAVVELPLTVIDSPGTQSTIITTIQAVIQTQGSTFLLPPLDEAFDMFVNDASGSARRVFILTDGGVADEPAAEARCEDLRTMGDPVTICTSLVGVLCPQEDESLKNCANTCDAQTFNASQPIGVFRCADEIADIALLCQECLPTLLPLGEPDCDEDGIPDAFELDCDLNGFPDECDAPPSFCEANELTKLLASDPAADDRLGTAVAIDDEVVVAGAPRDDDACPGDPDCNSGAAYVYVRDGSSWVQQAKLTAADGAGGDLFGQSVAVAGDVVVVGAPNKSDAGSGAGAAYVYRRDAGGPDNWGQVKRLIPTDLQMGDKFGFSVAAACNRVLVGAPGNADAGPNTGSAYVFHRFEGGENNWGQVMKLLAGDAAALDEFGTAVAFSGDTAIIGAPGNEAVGANPGAAYVFKRFSVTPDDLWAQTDKLTPLVAPEDNDFGSSVSLQGRTALVGATPATCCGPSAFTFVFDGGQWVQQEQLTAVDVLPEDEFATSLAVSADVVVIGASHNSEAGPLAGAAYVFRFDGTEWIPLAKVKASDPFLLDEFATSVAASCGRAVLGSPGDDDGGLQSGSVYLVTGLGDCNDNGGLDACDVATGMSPDADGDGVPDECASLGCGARIRVAQESAPGAGDFDANVLGCLLPFDVPVSGAEFYGYDDVANWHEGSHVCTVPDRSNLLLAATTDGLSLVTVHDHPPNDPDGGFTEMRFEISGDPDGLFRTVSDDPHPGDLYTGDPGDSVFTTVQGWAPCCTDGQVLSGIDGDWTILVQFTEVDGNAQTGPIEGLTEWVAVSACGADIPLALVADRRVRLDLEAPCPWDLDGDGLVIVTDLLILLMQWGTDPGGPPDFDGDGTVIITDFLELIAHWGACP